ncbi:glycogen debranching enzyme [Anaerosacchariphilus sp. NSJ-68]|uniref:Glycogen debranching enzyme n=2 Tax=Lachnospiraceae TaxID=186803 RepID=A0A923LAV6_9FIRM|nr:MULTISPECIES: alpha-amylase family glycosyl hydrolase [Lachnospiraceae]MBC5659148.1 glycogen debranching enzyme [Anaerosacchariphilus hominis]MBC5696814.1 glycogen debranching enzyme [Roseburia difficilis]
MREEHCSMKPLDEVAGFPVRPGLYEMYGATALEEGVNFTVHSHGATSCELLLYHRKAKEPYAVLPFPERYRIGKVYSMIVFGLDIEEFEYAYRLDGPWNPEKGLLFSRDHVLLDPYARAVTGQSVWGEMQKQEGLYHARVVKNNFDWGDAPDPSYDMSDLIIYELHVRGFTRHSSSGVKHPGTFAGLREKIPYLRELGVTAVELMPIFEFDETMGKREVDGRTLLDYWGYNTVSFFAPNTAYTAAEEYNREGTELKELIRDLHGAGIEVILDVVFNHTAEGNENGPFISFKGFDNQIYYMLTPEGFYYNFSGCGNTLNCNHPIVQELIVECLRYWVSQYRVDGFRFDLASILGRSEDGSPMSNPPLLKQLAFDPLLGNTKLIAEAWDAGGLYQVGSFPAWKRWAEWNGRYRDTLRSFLKGDYWFAPEAASRIAGSGDLYSENHTGYSGSNSSVNFLTCHDGFTLRDLYSYNGKHNEANGWNNTDGADDNRSWNCGEEGETKEPRVRKLRLRLMKNACAVLLCSRGTPMFPAGDERGKTQCGNNNAYCQDNEISWMNWEETEEAVELYEFFRFMIGFRKSHPAIRRELPKAVCGFPGISFHTERAWDSALTSDTRAFGVLYAGYEKEKNRDDLVYLAVNPWWEGIHVALPALPEGKVWILRVCTCDGEAGAFYPEGKEKEARGDSLYLGARSVLVLEAREEN